MISSELLSNLLKDEEYVKYIEDYNKTGHINNNLLDNLFEKYYNLYRLFMKMNILLYRYDTPLLDEDLKDYNQIDGKSLFIIDLDNIMKYYINNYNRCKDALKRLYLYRKTSPAERRIIRKIINRKIDEELSAIPISYLG